MTRWYRRYNLQRSCGRSNCTHDASTVAAAASPEGKAFEVAQVLPSPISTGIEAGRAVNPRTASRDHNLYLSAFFSMEAVTERHSFQGVRSSPCALCTGDKVALQVPTATGRRHVAQGFARGNEHPRLGDPRAAAPIDGLRSAVEAGSVSRGRP